MVWNVVAGPIVASIWGSALSGIFGGRRRRGPSVSGRAFSDLYRERREAEAARDDAIRGGETSPGETPPPTVSPPETGPPAFVIPGVPRPPVTSPPVWTPPADLPGRVPVTPRAVPLPNVPNVPWTRVLSRVLGIPGLILWPSTTADDDTIPDDYPYPVRVPPPREPVPLDLPEFPLERPVFTPPPRYFPQPKIPEPVKQPQPQPVRYRPPRPQIPRVQPVPRVPISLPEPYRVPTPTTAPTPTARPAPSRPRLPYSLPLFYPFPGVSPAPRVPYRFPTPGARPVSLPQPTQPGGLTLPQPGVRPLTQPQPQASQCPPCKPRDCEQVKRRRRKKGQCRQGYFREYPDRTEYITWSRRKCL